MLQAIEIENFRGFDHLKIEDFKRCNLFVGDNNSGKTSVLEALYFGCPKHTDETIQNLNMIRGYSRDKSVFWGYYFKDRNKPIKIAINTNGKEPGLLSCRSELINLETDFYLRTAIQERTVSNTDGISAFFYFDKENNNALPILKTFYKRIREYNEKSPEDIKIRFEIVHDHYNGWFSNKNIYNSSHTSILVAPSSYLRGNNIHHLSYIEKRNLLPDFIRLLSSIFPEVLDIALIEDDVIVCGLKDSLEKLPISFLGDGVNRAITILLSIFVMGKMDIPRYILIDEVEAGLHYTALLDLWKAIHQAAKELDVQVFATTHSMECVNAFTEAYNQLHDEDDSDDLRVYRIARNEKMDAIARKYDRERLNYIDETGWDIR